MVTLNSIWPVGAPVRSMGRGVISKTMALLGGGEEA